MTVKCSKRDEHLLVGLRLVVQFREKSAYWDIRSCERNINRIAWIRKSFGAFKERLEFVRRPRQEISFGLIKTNVGSLSLPACWKHIRVGSSYLFQIISVGQSLCGWSIQIMRRLGSKRISKYLQWGNKVTGVFEERGQRVSEHIETSGFAVPTSSHTAAMPSVELEAL